MKQLSLRWTLAGMEARVCLMGARLAISAARGLGSLGLLTPGGAAPRISRLIPARPRVDANLAACENPPQKS